MTHPDGWEVSPAAYLYTISCLYLTNMKTMKSARVWADRWREAYEAALRGDERLPEGTFPKPEPITEEGEE